MKIKDIKKIADIPDLSTIQTLDGRRGWMLYKCFDRAECRVYICSEKELIPFSLDESVEVIKYGGIKRFINYEQQ